MAGEQLPPHAPVVGPWRHRGFRWFFTGQSVSLAGSAMTPVALSFAVLAAAHHSGDLAVVLAAQSLTLLAFLLVGGAVADRSPRARVLVWSNLGAGLTQGMVAALLLTSHYHLPLIALLEMSNGACTAFTLPALRGLVPQLVDRDGVQKANSLLSTSRGVTKILGPSAAGAVVAGAAGGWAIALDAASFGVAAYCMSRVALPKVPASATIAARPSMLTELRLGWREFRARGWVLVVVSTFGAANFVLAGVWLVLGPTIAQHTIGARGWGIALSAQAAGVLAMSMIMYRLTPRYPLRWSQSFAALFTLPMLALGLSWPTPWLAAAAFVAGTGFAVDQITWATAMQQHIPADVLSRVSSYDTLGSYVAVPLGQLAVVPLAAAFGNTRIAIAGAIAWAALTLGALAVPSVRQLRNPVRTY